MVVFCQKELTMTVEPLPSKRAAHARVRAITALVAATVTVSVAAALWTVAAIRGDYKGTLAVLALLAIVCGMAMWLVGVVILIDERSRRKRAIRERFWPEHEKVTGNSYRLPLTIVHTFSFSSYTNRGLNYNTTTYTHKFKTFPYIVSPVASSPEANEIECEVSCPYCGDTLLLLASQRAFVVLNEGDFTSEQYSRSLRYAFLKRQLMTLGPLWAFLLCVPSFLGGALPTVSDPGAPLKGHDLMVGLGVWFAATAAALGVICVACRSYPVKRNLFMVRGSRSVLWRAVDHNRFFKSDQACQAGSRREAH